MKTILFCSFAKRMEKTAGIIVDNVGIEIQQRFFEFLQLFRDEEEDEDHYHTTYARHISEMVERESTTLFVDFQHLQDYDMDLAEEIEDEYYR